MSADLHYNACPIIANASQAGHFALSDMLLVLLTRVSATTVWQEPLMVCLDCIE